MKTSIYEELRDDIVGGLFEPGSPLVETTLAEHYGVSRTPIHEALLQLLRDGLVERSDRGIAVAERSPEKILEIYEVRILLEAAAARLAATRRTELDLNRLARTQDDMANLKEGETALRVRANTIFHEQLWQASHNSTLVEMMQRLIVRLGRYPETTLDYPGRWQAVLAEHKALLAAIRDGDADEAERIADEHMTAARLRSLETLVPSVLPPGRS
jgi:DNA-binding GntR family transcriptional regulator